MQINSNNSINFGCDKCNKARELLLKEGGNPKAVDKYIDFFINSKIDPITLKRGAAVASLFLSLNSG